MVSREVLRWRGWFAVVAGLVIAGCNDGNQEQVVVGPSGGETGLGIHAAKAAVSAEARQRAVVYATVTRNGAPVGNAEVSFSRSISGRAPEYLWKATTGDNGTAEVELIESGYYLIRAIDTTSGALIGKWGSVPINTGEEITMSLPVGRRVDITAISMLEAPPPSAAPSAETQAVWAQIQGYDAWAQWPEGKEKKFSASHSNMWVESYYNSVVGDFMASGAQPPLPAGSIIVKENFKDESDAEPAVLTVMKKQDDGNWYWIKALAGNGRVLLGPDGKTPAEGEAVSTCIGCHTSTAAAGNDLVVTHTF